MVWLQPLALLGLVAVAAPLLIHLLRRQPARRVIVPTVRFVPKSSHSALRLRPPADPLLLGLRTLILAGASIALAAPLLTTAARYAEWDARIARAVVVDPGARDALSSERLDAMRGSAFVVRTFESEDIRDALNRASAWLDAAPPARREIVIASDFRHGVLWPADFVSVADEVGLRFERIARDRRSTARDVAVLFEGRRWSRRTEVSDQRTAATYVETDAGAGFVASQTALEAAAIAGAPAPDPDRSLELRFGAGAAGDRIDVDEPWQLRAAQSVLLDPDAAHGRPSVTVENKGLNVSSPVDPETYDAARLATAVLESLQDPSSLVSAEVRSIPFETLEAWSREPARVDHEQWRHADRNDGRWLWGIVLLFLALEAIVRWRSDSKVEEVHADAA